MAGLAHLGVGLAAKRLAPDVNAGALVVAAYGIDIVWAGFWAAGLEQFPGPGVSATAPWSHGLFMAVIWSAAAGLLALAISRNRRTSLLIGLLVFSHWVVDFIAKPMTYTFPDDVGVPLFFAGSPVVGLGVWGTAVGQTIGEYGTALLGFLIYLVTRWQVKQAKGAVIAR